MAAQPPACGCSLEPFGAPRRIRTVLELGDVHVRNDCELQVVGGRNQPKALVGLLCCRQWGAYLF